ncbi:hypothetical protein E4U43_005758 [Claviceps pusilla]|uniref:Uncharacterized protein n=1 Tax=Claviceps pusilla TaxID=123648 RepID=A0A9P7N435_9HYPO|nr:hypothetical protein E4U43_005758 [Claviceps pusilla]
MGCQASAAERLWNWWKKSASVVVLSLSVGSGFSIGGDVARYRPPGSQRASDISPSPSPEYEYSNGSFVCGLRTAGRGE